MTTGPVEGFMLGGAAAARVAVWAGAYRQASQQNGRPISERERQLIDEITAYSRAAVAAASENGNGIRRGAEMPAQLDQEMSTCDAAARLGLSERRVRQLLTNGDLAGRRVGSRWAITESAVRGHLATQTSKRTI